LTPNTKAPLTQGRPGGGPQAGRLRTELPAAARRGGWWVAFAVIGVGLVAAAGGAERALLPKEVAGCVWWIKADAGVLTNHSGGVTNWVDQSGLGHSMDQLNGQEPRVVRGLNGHPAIRFSRAGSMFGAFDFGSNRLADHSLLLLARWTETNAASCQRILSSHLWNWTFGYMEGHDQSWYANGYVYHGDWSLYGAGAINTNWHLHTGSLMGGTNPVASFWKDDTLLMEAQARPGIQPNTLQPRQIEVNGLRGNQRSECEVAEAILYDRVLSEAELKGIWRYFATRYGIHTPVNPTPPQQVVVSATSSAYPIADGPFRPDWRSFQQYECPEWFRDAKFGIWAHWSPQCQPEQGDWYAYHMYKQGSRQYQYHVGHYGHPSQFGYKDICHAWKAENWDPGRLMQLYQRAGAKYFVALANHHCNFDCWDSTYQPWNSVNIGPKQDIVGTWAALARQHGLRFGVSVHSARAWEWYEVAHGADTNGPLQGAPYDGALTRADGRGKWWEGYDPADLYGPHGAARTREARQAYIRKWFDRTKDLVDRYQPDLLYFDDTVPPLGEAGMNVVAHFCNANLQRHQGKLEAVFNTKIYDAHPPREVYGRLVNDFEGGRADSIQPYPWQTDTCIGNWHYYRGAEYRTAREVIQELIDIVSKNGNLLLNLPLKGDGTLDAQELKFLDELTRWMDINGEGIYGTRPFRILGEGKVRFTTKGRTLYVFYLGWPDGPLTVPALARNSPLVRGRLAEVRLLGFDGKLKWSRTDAGLVIQLPEQKPCDHAVAFKITGLETVAARGPSTPAPSASTPR
jgi:alpha-L-fucosidase